MGGRPSTRVIRVVTILSQHKTTRPTFCFEWPKLETSANMAIESPYARISPRCPRYKISDRLSVHTRTLLNKL